MERQGAPLSEAEAALVLREAPPPRACSFATWCCRQCPGVSAYPTPRPPTPRSPTQRPPTPRPPTQRQPRTRRPTYGLPQMGRNYNDGTVPYVLVSRRPPYEQCSNSRLCGICEGDCDNDSHCSGKLKCFIRHGSEAVPGCSGGNDKAGKDFCYDPNPSPVPYNSNDVWFSF